MIPGDDQNTFSLEAGIKAARFDAPTREALARLRQGVLVRSPPLIYGASADRPLFAASVAWATSDRAGSGAVNLVTRAHRAPWGCIVTQTCDLVEEGAKPKRPWVHIAPVYVMQCDSGSQRLIESERGFAYLCPVTGLDPPADGGLWVADLRLLVPVEKGWLVGVESCAGFNDEAGYDRLARQLSQQFSRPAYNTALGVHVLRPLSKLLQSLAKAHDGDDGVLEVGLALGRSRMNPTSCQVVFVADRPLTEDVLESIFAWGQNVLDDPPPDINMLMPRIALIDEMSARDFRKLELIDVSAYSPPEDEDFVAVDGESAADEPVV